MSVRNFQKYSTDTGKVYYFTSHETARRFFKSSTVKTAMWQGNVFENLKNLRMLKPGVYKK